MKRTELRIGNLVQNEQGLICKISKIDNEDNNHLIRGWQIRNEAFGTDAPKPIIITKDWMVKFGWGRGEYDTEYIDNVSLTQYSLSYTLNSNMFCIEANSDIVEIPNIKYVHQLQNLFFMITGKELIFEL